MLSPATAMPRQGELVRRPIILASEGAIEPCAHCGMRRVSVCDAIPESGLKRLVFASVQGVAPTGRIFVDEGEPATGFFNITSGTAKLYKLLPDGRRQITGFAGPGHFLGLAVSETYAFSAEAIDTVRYCLFPRARLRGLLEEFPALEARLLADACNELAAAQEQMLLLGQKTASERLASFLIARSKNGAPCGTPQRRFELPMGRGDIAGYLGLTVETVSRTFTRFRNQKLIETPTANVIVILKPEALDNIAEANG